jgi:hypothetical protein
MTPEQRKYELGAMFKDQLINYAYNLEQKVEELEKRELPIWKAFGQFSCVMALQANDKIK